MAVCKAPARADPLRRSTSPPASTAAAGRPARIIRRLRKGIVPISIAGNGLLIQMPKALSSAEIMARTGNARKGRVE